VGGSHDFQHLVNEVAADVIAPETGIPIGQRLRAKTRIAALEHVNLGLGNVHGHKRIVLGARRDSARTLGCSTVGPPQHCTCITDAGTSSFLPCLSKSVIAIGEPEVPRRYGILDRIEILHDPADLGFEVAPDSLAAQTS
jgi:hypothetical protein